MSEGFVKVTSVGSIPPGSMKTVKVLGEQVVVANISGNFFALGAICTHEGWDLSEGTLEGERITCAGHGSIWDLGTGKAEFDEPIPPEPLYEVRVEGEDLYLKKKA